METSKFTVKATFITPLLGSQPQVDIAEEHLSPKNKDNGGVLPQDELESLPEMLEKGTTAFHKIDGKPVLWDYQIKGFLKEAGKIFNGLQDVKAMRSKIGNLVFVKPRWTEIHIPEGKQIEFLSRPLRAETAQGPRVAIARSEVIPEGSWFDFNVEIFKGQIDIDLVTELMTYGEYQGLGQWRNGGYGRFTFEILK